MTNEELFKEIDLIQGCINRMSKNSFLIKGWTISVFAIVFAIAKEQMLNDTALVICSIFIPVLCFWLLDSYFLHTEKKYRKMYQWVLRQRKDGSLDKQFDLEPTRFNREVGCYFKTLFSITLSVFYLIPIISIVLLLICF